MLPAGVIERALTGGVSRRKALRLLDSLYRDDIYRVGVLNRRSELPKSPHTTVLVRTGDKENVYDRSRILDVALANARLLTALNQLAATDSIDVDFYYNIGRHFILPNLWVNMNEYNRRVREGLEQLTTVKEVVNQGDVIVSARQPVSERQEEVLKVLADLLRNEATNRGWWLPLLPVLARIALVLGAFGIMYLFLSVFRMELFRSNPKLLGLALVFVIQMGLTYAVECSA
jgi:membrane-associated HD superfamily phosphohydrolase